MTDVVVGITVITSASFLCSFYREVGLAEALDGCGEGGTSRALSTAVVCNEAPCQLHMEGF